MALVLCLAAACLSACDSAAGSPQRKLVWSDEFDGENGALPDPDKWDLEQFADATDDEKQCYTDSTDNVHTDGNGYLVISAHGAGRQLRRRLVPLHHLGPAHHPRPAQLGARPLRDPRQDAHRRRHLAGVLGAR